MIPGRRGRKGEPAGPGGGGGEGVPSRDPHEFLPSWLLCFLVALYPRSEGRKERKKKYFLMKGADK